MFKKTIKRNTIEEVLINTFTITGSMVITDAIVGREINKKSVITSAGCALGGVVLGSAIVAGIDKVKEIKAAKDAAVESDKDEDEDC